MTDAARPAALVLATADNPQLPQLADALAAQGMGCIICLQTAQALIRLARHDAPGEPIVVAIILEGISRMTVSALGKSLRGLPGRTRLPLLFVDGQAQAPFLSLAIPSPVAVEQLARLAATPPDQWMTTTPASSPAQPETIATSTAPRAEIILVVDDHEVNRTMLCLQARSAGLPIETCTDGAAAVARVAAGGVRLVLMDCQMPVMDGYEATRAIRQAEAGSVRHLPIIAVTAHAMEENHQRCIEAGMDDFLAKPLSQERVQTVIRRWLGTTSAMPTATVNPVVGNEVLDLQPLRRIDAQNPGLGQQLAGILLADLPTARESFQRLLAEGTIDLLSRAAHKLRGTSGSLGAMELYQASGALEKAARAGDHAACDRVVTAVVEAIDRLQPVLAAYASSNTKKGQ